MLMSGCLTHMGEAQRSQSDTFAKTSVHQLKRPYRRPIRTTVISAISRGSLTPVAPTSMTLRATISQSGSLRSTTPSRCSAWSKALFKSAISPACACLQQSIDWHCPAPSADANKTRRLSYSTGFPFTVGELRNLRGHATARSPASRWRRRTDLSLRRRRRSSTKGLNWGPWPRGICGVCDTSAYRKPE